MIEPLAPIIIPKRRNTCKNCKWWDVSEHATRSLYDDSIEVNECRGAPPIPYHGRTFPKTRSDDWCKNHDEHNPHVEALFLSTQDSPIIGLAADDDEDDTELGV